MKTACGATVISCHGGALSNSDAALAKETGPSCRLVRFDGVGHQIHRSSPARIGAVIRQWARDNAVLL